MNCNITERIVDRKMSTYDYCTSIQTANLFLSKTALDLYHILNALHMANMTSCIDDNTKASEMSISDYDGTEEWCILQWNVAITLIVLCVEALNLFWFLIIGSYIVWML